jgi:hypothetical protein
MASNLVWYVSICVEVCVALKGIAIWILGFFSFLAGLNAVSAVIMWADLGPTGTFTPSLLGGLTGAIPVYVYLLVSVLVTLAFLGATSHMVVSQLSVGDQIGVINEKANRLAAGQESQQNVLEGVKARVFLVDESLERARIELSNGVVHQGNAIQQSLEKGHQAQQKTLDGVQGRVFLVEESIKGVKKGLGEQTEAIKGVNANVADVAPKLADVRETVARQLGIVESTLTELETSDKKTVAAIAKQRDEIAEIKLKLERLESELFKPEPLLTSQSNVEAIKGIGTGKGAELKEIGITNVGDLIMADPKVVAEKMGSSEKTVEKLQGRAQLSMIPKMKDKDLSLLEELDIVDRKSLAEQDPIELGKKINAIFKVNLAKGKVTEADKPTIEEIDSWVRFVRA